MFHQTYRPTIDFDSLVDSVRHDKNSSYDLTLFSMDVMKNLRDRSFSWDDPYNNDLFFDKDFFSTLSSSLSSSSSTATSTASSSISYSSSSQSSQVPPNESYLNSNKNKSNTSTSSSSAQPIPSNISSASSASSSSSASSASTINYISSKLSTNTYNPVSSGTSMNSFNPIPTSYNKAAAKLSKITSNVPYGQNTYQPYNSSSTSHNTYSSTTATSSLSTSNASKPTYNYSSSFAASFPSAVTSPSSLPPPLPATLASLPIPQVSSSSSFSSEDNNRKVGAYTIQQRKEKIEKFREKKTKMAYAMMKKIKYDCRKKLADTRPRVKGRFISQNNLLEPYFN